MRADRIGSSLEPSLVPQDDNWTIGAITSSSQTRFSRFTCIATAFQPCFHHGRDTLIDELLVQRHTDSIHEQMSSCPSSPPSLLPERIRRLRRATTSRRQGLSHPLLAEECGKGRRPVRPLGTKGDQLITARDVIAERSGGKVMHCLSIHRPSFLQQASIHPGCCPTYTLRHVKRGLFVVWSRPSHYAAIHPHQQDSRQLEVTRANASTLFLGHTKAFHR